jgi:hypothetical protein
MSVLLTFLFWTVPPLAGLDASVGNGLSSPVYVNLYWDTNWDSDNPSMPKAELDAFTFAILSSSYFGGLAEYGVSKPSFGGGFLPQQNWCTIKAPAQVGFYDPVNPSIIGFLQCELVHGGIPQGPQVVYNIILPQTSEESDFFGNVTFCGNGPGTAWHFHQTPYSPGAAVAIGAGLLGVATGGVPGALEAFVGALATLQGGPLYTIESANPACGVFTDNLLHEMVEAASDPFPSPGAIWNEDEIADVAAKCPATHSFVPPSPVVALPSQTSFPTSGAFTTNATISVPQYWSNAGQKCIPGFTDPTIPKVNQPTMTGNGADLTFTITGSGFGSLPSTNSTVPYIAIQDKAWQAGNSLNSDTVALNVSSWTNSAITINGFNFTNGNLHMQPGDPMALWVCNPSSGNCGPTTFKLTESGSPQLKVLVANAANVNLLFDISVDGTMVASGVGTGGGTAWLTLGGGNHVISETSTTAGFFNALFRGGCNQNGDVSLKLGDNNFCTIVNVASTGCASGLHCCSGASTESGCLAGCISDTIACQPLCPPQAPKCCGGASPNGQCDGACIRSGQCP